MIIVYHGGVDAMFRSVLGSRVLLVEEHAG